VTVDRQQVKQYVELEEFEGWYDEFRAELAQGDKKPAYFHREIIRRNIKTATLVMATEDHVHQHQHKTGTDLLDCYEMVMATYVPMQDIADNVSQRLLEKTDKGKKS
jgi:hypothetical protein